MTPHIDEFLSRISNPNKVSVVYFYTKWCGFCKSLTPSWKKVASQLKKIPQVQLLQVDCERYPDIAKMHNVRQYPTIIAFKGSRTNYATLENTRTEGDLKRFVLNNTYEKQQNDIRNPVRELSMTDFVDTQSGRWMLLFHLPGCKHCTEIMPEWHKAAAKSVQKEWPVQFASLNCLTNIKIADSLKLAGYPTVMAVSNKNMVGIYYGSKDASKIMEYAQSTFSKSFI